MCPEDAGYENQNEGNFTDSTWTVRYVCRSLYRLGVLYSSLTSTRLTFVQIQTGIRSNRSISLD